MNTAVLYSAYGSRASYYDDWLDAFQTSDAFDVSTFNIAEGSARSAFIKSVAAYDLIIALHSVNADNLTYLSDIKGALQARKGRFFSFVGNEVNLPGAPLKPKIDFLRHVEADYVATQLLLETGQYLYGETGAQVLGVPHALNPNAFRPVMANADRPIEIGMRTFRYPAIFLGDEDRNQLIDLFSANPFEPPLAVDISTDKRLDRAGWADFLNHCQGTVANEAGGYWIEKDDATMQSIKDWLMGQGGGGAFTIKSDTPLRRVVHKLPWNVRQLLIKLLSCGPVRHEALIGKDADFDEVYRRFFADKPWPAEISGKCASSRHFDAAGTKTCQVMIEGRFNDVFRADEHYIPMKRDLSDADEAVRKFRDASLRSEIVERTHQYVMEAHTYSHRIKQIEAALNG